LKYSKRLTLKNKVILIGLASLVLMLFSMLMASDSTIKNNVITRPNPGENTRYEELQVSDDDGNLITKIKAVIEPKQLSKDEIKSEFEIVYQEILIDMLNNNESLDCVQSDLNLVESSRDNIVLCEWYSSDYEIINYDGKVNNYSFKENQTEEVELILILKYLDARSEYSIFVNVVPAKRDTVSWATKVIQDSVTDAIEDNANEDIVLPESVEGKKLHYSYYKDEMNPAVFLALGAVAIAVLIYGENTKKKKQQEIRKKELKYDYAEIVSKLTLLLGAGMTTRTAWKKITGDYIKQKESGAVKKKCAYEEMLITEYNMNAGISELKAYEAFGKSCDTKEYMKLATLLQTNIKKGTRELRRLLEEEAENAFEQRKSMAVIKGEEATTKLLLPMMMMLIVVMVIIMVPAMMNFNI